MPVPLFTLTLAPSLLHLHILLMLPPMKKIVLLLLMNLIFLPPTTTCPSPVTHNTALTPAVATALNATLCVLITLQLLLFNQGVLTLIHRPIYQNTYVSSAIHCMYVR